MLFFQKKMAQAKPNTEQWQVSQPVICHGPTQGAGIVVVEFVAAACYHGPAALFVEGLEAVAVLMGADDQLASGFQK